MAHTSVAPAEAQISAVRAFNRFYTRQIGVLREGLLQSPFSLTEVRVLYEVAHRRQPTAAELCQELGVDPGYLSRILRAFERQGLLSKSASRADGRQQLLALTTRGQQTFAALDSRQSAEVAAMLRRIPSTEQIRLVRSMHAIETVLGGAPEAKTPYLLRSHQPGDMGWVVHRHGALYSQEYRYSEHFEALVAEIVAQFIQHFDSHRERCWIAERNGENVGSVFLVKKSKTVAKLRLLLVEPAARGLGIGKRLVDECIRFARQAGYKKVILWTQSELSAARHLYKQAGFRRVQEKPHQSWGRQRLVAEVWELTLKHAPSGGST